MGPLPIFVYHQLSIKVEAMPLKGYIHTLTIRWVAHVHAYTREKAQVQTSTFGSVV